MIFYEQNNQQIGFLLDESVCSEISNWNREHLASKLSNWILPLFQITLIKDKNDAIYIKFEELYHLTSAEGNRFKQDFEARLVDTVMSTTSFKQIFEARLVDKLMSTTSIEKIRHPYLDPPEYKLPDVVLLQIDLVKYANEINGWQNWISEDALSDRYIYGFGEIY
jgi:hypothetical protein